MRWDTVSLDLRPASLMRLVLTTGKVNIRRGIGLFFQTVFSVLIVVSVSVIPSFVPFL